MKIFWTVTFYYTLLEEKILPKKNIVKQLINPGHCISTQVIGENVNVCLKKFRLDKLTSFSHARNLLQNFTIITIQKDTLEKSFQISNSYQLGFWDSLIIASALQANCSLLYSEDMHDGLIVENTLTITNPFKNL
jgi:predicted nucleic acid-binding protein